MEKGCVERAVGAATSVATALGLPVDDVAIIRNSNKLSLHLLPCNTFARVALIGDEVATLEVELAQKLLGVDAPVAALEARVEPLVYLHDRFAITLWTYHRPLSPASPLSVEYAQALVRLHSGMRRIEVAVPHFTDRIAEAQSLVANHDQTRALNIADRGFLLDTLNDARNKIDLKGAAEQLLHGEPHSGNILNTTNGALFIDLETCCIGPVEFDVAHVPFKVSAHYANLDHDLLNECRRLVLAMVAAWRWDVQDQFPDGLRHGHAFLAVLRSGSPWPALGELPVS
jgi:hypothetical protein